MFVTPQRSGGIRFSDFDTATKRCYLSNTCSCHHLGLAWGFSPTNRAKRTRGALAPGPPLGIPKCPFSTSSSEISAHPEDGPPQTKPRHLTKSIPQTPLSSRSDFVETGREPGLTPLESNFCAKNRGEGGVPPKIYVAGQIRAPLRQSDRQFQLFISGFRSP